MSLFTALPTPPGAPGQCEGNAFSTWTDWRLDDRLPVLEPPGRRVNLGDSTSYPTHTGLGAGGRRRHRFARAAPRAGDAAVGHGKRGGALLGRGGGKDPLLAARPAQRRGITRTPR